VSGSGYWPGIDGTVITVAPAGREKSLAAGDDVKFVSSKVFPADDA
jgi:hypothetical protein